MDTNGSGKAGWHGCQQLNKEEPQMRKLLSLFLVLTMIPAVLPGAAAEPYTLDIWWVGNGAVPEVQEGVEKAINESLRKSINGSLSVIDERERGARL